MSNVHKIVNIVQAYMSILCRRFHLIFILKENIISILQIEEENTSFREDMQYVQSHDISNRKNKGLNLGLWPQNCNVSPRDI